MNFDELENNTVIEFLKTELEFQDENDAENVFLQLSRFTDMKDTRTIDEILSAAEILSQQQRIIESKHPVKCPAKSQHHNQNVNTLKAYLHNSYVHSIETKETHNQFNNYVDNKPKKSVPAEQSTVMDQINANVYIKKEEYNNNDCRVWDETEDFTDKKNEVLDVSQCVQIDVNGVENQSMHNNGHTSKKSSPINEQNAAMCVNGADNVTEFSDLSLCSTSSVSPPIRTSKIQPTATSSAINREQNLKKEIDSLNIKLKQTEERLESLLIKNESLSAQLQDLRENNAQLEEESDMLKSDVNHLNKCCNNLRYELKLAQEDRTIALNLKKKLQTDLLATRQQLKQLNEICEKDQISLARLRRQCEEMEKSLIAAAKNVNESVNKYNPDSVKSHQLLEQRIAQLETDAKEQDVKAQKILTNVQSRFNSVQAKYETHIADLETQVLSLQEINTKLNEKIASKSLTMANSISVERDFVENSTQTEEAALLFIAKTKTCDQSTNTIGAISRVSNMTNSHASPFSSCSSTANSTPNNSRPSSKQNGIRKPFSSASHLSVSQSDTTICSTASNVSAKENAHLLTSIRTMRIQLSIKDKAIQQLTRELEECKKNLKKLQKEKILFNNNALNRSTSARRPFGTEKGSQLSLREAKQKINALENDYKYLNEKRLQDLKTLQMAHQREMAQCSETIRVIQQCFNEYDVHLIQTQNMPIDYYALKDKVISLERRHTEREKRMHDLLEELSNSLSIEALKNLSAVDKINQ